MKTSVTDKTSISGARRRDGGPPEIRCRYRPGCSSFLACDEKTWADLIAINSLSFTSLKITTLIMKWPLEVYISFEAMACEFSPASSHTSPKWFLTDSHASLLSSPCRQNASPATSSPTGTWTQSRWHAGHGTGTVLVVSGSLKGSRSQFCRWPAH